jgi:hypothetical protein
MGINYICQGHFLLFGRYDGNNCPITFRKKMTFRTYFILFKLILEQISLDSQNLKRFGIKILGFSFL